MKQGRTPDRVHVVRPPHDDQPLTPNLPAPRDGRAMEIVRTLAQISDKLKRSEAERYELLAELREYRKSLHELEDRAGKSEKAYAALENKLNAQSTIDNEISQRQARFERALKETESKLVQAAAGQALLDQRVKSNEEMNTAITQRLDESVTEQARITRHVDKIGQDKTRMLRKVERMEEILTETQDTLRARALVLLTDQSAAAQGSLPQISAWSDTSNNAASESEAPWWRKSVRMQGVGMASMVVAALLFGWTINQIQQPDMPKIAVLENGGLARLNLEQNRWEPISRGTSEDGIDAPVTPDPMSSPTLEPLNPQTLNAIPANAVTGTAIEQTPAAQEVLNSSDEALLAAMEENPDQLAAQLNEIAPAVQQELELSTQAGEPAPSVNTQAAGLYNPLDAYASEAFAQDPAVSNLIAKARSREPLSAQMASDATLPAAAQSLQQEAYKGIAEAQHDLAAIYTAGRSGVNQNFNKAAFWFEQSAHQGVANAAYNLGVLYHQGLGVDRDLDRALYWYREAAKKGHPEAQYNLGISHIEGIGTEYNAPLAAAFFESSANQGVVEAAYNLGLIHENALLGAKSKQEDALMWYKVAADGGSTDAKAALRQLANNLQIGMEDVNKMSDRMQAIYKSAHGRNAGPKA